MSKLTKEDFKQLMFKNFDFDHQNYTDCLKEQAEIHLSYRTSLYMEVLHNPEVSDEVKIKIIESLN